MKTLVEPIWEQVELSEKYILVILDINFRLLGFLGNSLRLERDLNTW